MLNKDDAEKIAKKLKARIHRGSAHDIAVIEYEENTSPTLVYGADRDEIRGMDIFLVTSI